MRTGGSARTYQKAKPSHSHRRDARLAQRLPLSCEPQCSPCSRICRTGNVSCWPAGRAPGACLVRFLILDQFLFVSAPDCLAAQLPLPFFFSVSLFLVLTWPWRVHSAPHMSELGSDGHGLGVAGGRPAASLSPQREWKTWGRPITYSMMILKKSESTQTSLELALSRLLVCPTFPIHFRE